MRFSCAYLQNSMGVNWHPSNEVSESPLPKLIKDCEKPYFISKILAVGFLKVVLKCDQISGISRHKRPNARRLLLWNKMGFTALKFPSEGFRNAIFYILKYPRCWKNNLKDVTVQLHFYIKDWTEKNGTVPKKYHL